MGGQAGDRGELLGCFIGLVGFIGGPVLTAWICIAVFGWPTWISIILALLIGGTVSHIVIMAILLPLFGMASLFSSGKERAAGDRESGK